MDERPYYYSYSSEDELEVIMALENINKEAGNRFCCSACGIILAREKKRKKERKQLRRKAREMDKQIFQLKQDLWSTKTSLAWTEKDLEVVLTINEQLLSKLGEANHELSQLDVEKKEEWRRPNRGYRKILNRSSPMRTQHKTVFLDLTVIESSE